MTEITFLENIKRKMLRKYPAFGATISNVHYQVVDDDHPIKTAATDGKTIYVNKSFLSSLPEDEQVFTFAHEVCHIALKHISRSMGRDQKLWNIATDAVINQHLKKDGLTMPKGCVDIKDALSYDAEELYEKLLKEKEQQQQNGEGQQSQNGQQQNEQGQGQDNSQSEKKGKNDTQNGQSQGGGQEKNEKQVGHDDHSMWEEAARREEQERQKGKKAQGETEENQEISEKKAFKQNEEEVIRRANDVMERISSKRRGLGTNKRELWFNNLGMADKAVVNWERQLICTLEKEDEAWGHKFSDKRDGYAVRIEDVEYEEKAETEIILDVSGSVSVDLLKNFLRQVKRVLRNSSIRVGTFSDDFNGFIEIKRKSDIDSLRIVVGGETNFDAASRAFTKRKDVNKICFTDGWDGGDAEIKDKRKDIVWISFENPNFQPDYGKVLYVTKEQINLGCEPKNEPENEPEM